MLVKGTPRATPEEQVFARRRRCRSRSDSFFFFFSYKRDLTEHCIGTVSIEIANVLPYHVHIHKYKSRRDQKEDIILF